MLKLQKLNIELQLWGKHEGRYLAEISYKDSKGGINLALSPGLSEDLLRFTGKAIKKYSEDAAKELQEVIALSIEKAKKGENCK